jgi:hypothetical protein
MEIVGRESGGCNFDVKRACGRKQQGALRGRPRRGLTAAVFQYEGSGSLLE